MFKNVIVGVDGHEGGLDAIALARRLVAADSKLTLAHVFGLPEPWAGMNPEFKAAERQKAVELLAATREENGLDADIRAVGAPRIGQGLHLLAEAHHADLLVVGSCHRGLLGRVFVGDDARAALNGAPCAVAIAPTGYAYHPTLVREVGVGWDGSPESDYAMSVARELAADHGAKLSAFQAVSMPAMTLSAGTLPLGEALEKLVDEARARIAAHEGIEPHAAYGEPAEELALYGASLDLLVVGSRGYGPFGRLVHGSTTRTLAHTARCPLLVLTRGAREAHDAAAETNGQVPETVGTP